jgi:flavin reductase (DIM6/NTAB) family NADH-FMN oxidoreductase RutF
MTADDELRSRFIAAMASVATPVTVVTSDGAHGRTGLTVSAVTSVSVDPPLLLACVNRRSPAVAIISSNGHFAVNILAQEARGVAETFSGRPREGLAYDFSRDDWEVGALAQPLLPEAVASFECAVEQSFDAGTHRIFIGAIKAVRHGTAHPLVYFNRRFARVTND